MSEATSQNWAQSLPLLISEAELGLPVLSGALGWAGSWLPAVREVMDLGSGAGVLTLALAEAFGRARVTAVDGTPELLEAVTARAREAGLDERVRTALRDLPGGVADLPAADLVWASQVVHHLPDPVRALEIFGDRLTPAGVLLVREGGLPTRFLPDGEYPGLLARLEAAVEQRASGLANPAGLVTPRGAWPDLIRRAGLKHLGSSTFVTEVQAPVPEGTRTALARRLGMFTTFAGDLLSAADREAIGELVDPGSPRGVLRREDLYVLAAGTVHAARRARP
ncbi:class I SAM-dependent methyltransferase [Kineosporia sp. J2-2]|uniref:Class I SAM-dependent methyltransferase n=1 Tax=Kineosporia corallincola TaxID=2835133 RepID=A0ABS5TT87_9ACTN|nr:class I SAM-dependent methyltransferase [Kineosporia corallincola]MBT0774022.1 class I SAM-dependent methyltransferase [Kineosporia corallincola]